MISSRTSAQVVLQLWVADQHDGELAVALYYHLGQSLYGDVTGWRSGAFG